jgi:hypothetical protein
LITPTIAAPNDGRIGVRQVDPGNLVRASDAGPIAAGGLALSQLLTLYTTPVVYLYLDRLQSWFRRDEQGDVKTSEMSAVAAE